MADEKDKGKKNKQIDKELLEQISKLTKEYDASKRGVEELNDSLADLADTQRDAARTGEDLNSTLTGLLGSSSGFSQGVINLTKSISEGDSFIKGFTKSMTLANTQFMAMSAGLNLLEKVFESTAMLIRDTDAALTSFQKSTGALSTYGSQITALEENMYTYGITIEEAADSQAGLIGSIRNLKDLGPAANEMLLENTAILNELGVESGTTAQSLGFMINSLGMTEDAAASTTREMFVLAQSLGRPPAEMAEAFNAAAPQLAAFGSRAGDVFRKMAVNAAAANMEVADMLRITEQFDKFDTAASAVGKLNAVLGGPYLSTVRMVTTTDPTERLKMMSDAARQAGKSFDDMSYYERKMTASAMGLKDVNELALVMSNNFDLVGDAVEKSAADIVELRKQTQSYNTIAEEFGQLTRSFAVNIGGPLVKAIKAFAHGLGMLAKGPIPAVVAGIGLIITAIGALSIALAVGSFGISALIQIFVAFMITVGSGFLLIIKTVVDVVKRSQPFVEKFSSVWEKITKAFEQLQKTGKTIKPTIDQIVEGFTEFFTDSPVISQILNDLADSLTSTFKMIAAINEKMSQSGVYSTFGKVIGVVTSAVLALVLGIIKLNELLIGVFHRLYVGNSPSLIAVFEMLASAISAVGEAFKFPIQMIGKMMTGLKDLASMLAGKALSFISGAISYVFGESPSTEVSNTGFSRGEDMDAMAVSIGEEVGKAVKEALQDMQMNNKVQLEVVSKHGLPTLFDFVQKNLDDVASGRPPNIALNASRAGIT